ncbi:MAG: hypothetical protein HFJ19_00615 [Clostridia bacterium]|nr:hypothetical protein [Clostridia bacterium]
MKKFIIYAIIIILIFGLSIYIGTKLKLPKVDEIIQQEESISSTKEDDKKEEKIEKEDEIEEIEPAVSKDETNKEHYVLREVSKSVKVYSIGNDEKEELYMTTNIATEYLPETDKLSLKEGIHVYSQNELYEILQDFE